MMEYEMMKKRVQWIIFLLMITGFTLVNAQVTHQLINVDGRNTISLDGLWRTIVDPYENGYYGYHGSVHTQPESGFGMDNLNTDKSVLQEYDFNTDKTLYVPGDWNTQRPELFYYEGTVWYRKRFHYQVKYEKRVFLHFGAVNYEAIVFVNGKEIGKHIGGFTPFNFEVTGLLKTGENSLVVKVDNKRYPDAVPTVNTDWWNYGGITRQVTLVETPATFVRDYYVQLKKGDKNTLTGWVQLDGKDLSTTVKVEIPELKISQNLIPDDNGFASFECKIKPVYWSPENPKLYSVNINSEKELISDEIGFRTIETEGTKILLNGTPVFLRGICIHEEAAYRNGRVYSADEAHTFQKFRCIGPSSGEMLKLIKMPKVSWSIISPGIKTAPISSFGLLPTKHHKVLNGCAFLLVSLKRSVRLTPFV